MAKTIRFLLDEHIPRAILFGLRRRDIDAVRPQDIERAGYTDAEQLEWANGQGRVVVTFDHDFLRLAAQQSAHAGVVYCYPDKYGIGELLGLLVLVHELLEPDELKNRIEYL